MVNEAGIYDRDWLGFDWSPWSRIEPNRELPSSLPTDPGYTEFGTKPTTG